jgi:hypothetical protein
MVFVTFSFLPSPDSVSLAEYRKHLLQKLPCLTTARSSRRLTGKKVEVNPTPSFQAKFKTGYFLYFGSFVSSKHQWPFL